MVLIDRIDPAIETRAHQSGDRRQALKGCNVAASAADVGFQFGSDEPRMRLDAIEHARQQRLFQVAIAQPSDRGNRDRDQHDHRDGKSGCERHLVLSHALLRPGNAPGRPGNAISHHGPEATPPAGWVDDATRLAASRQPATAASRAAGLNGFCRLVTAPSLVAMVRKSGACPESEDDRPAGDHDDRNRRPLLMNHPHGLEPVHSRHEDVEKQQIEIAGLEYREPLAAIAGGDDAVAGAFQQQPDGRLHRIVIVDDQDLRQVQVLRARAGITSTAGCKSC